MPTMSAVKAYQFLKTGLPGVADTIKKEVAAGNVTKVFQGDLDKMKKVNPDYLKWLTDNKLITTDQTKAPRTHVGGSEYGTKITAIVGPKFEQWKALAKQINAELVEKKSTLRVFSYSKDEAFVDPNKPAPTPAPVAGAPAPVKK